jgi:hypothetical protein
MKDSEGAELFRTHTRFVFEGQALELDFDAGLRRTVPLDGGHGAPGCGEGRANCKSDDDTTAPVKCPAMLHQPALTCPAGSTCCKRSVSPGGRGPKSSDRCREDRDCNVCAECCARARFSPLAD